MQDPTIAPYRQCALQCSRVLLKRRQQVRHHLSRAFGVTRRSAGGRVPFDARKVAADQFLDAGSLANRGPEIVRLVECALGAQWEISHHGASFCASAGVGL